MPLCATPRGELLLSMCVLYLAGSVTLTKQHRSIQAVDFSRWESIIACVHSLTGSSYSQQLLSILEVLRVANLVPMNGTLNIQNSAFIQVGVVAGMIVCTSYHMNYTQIRLATMREKQLIFFY